MTVEVGQGKAWGWQEFYTFSELLIHESTLNKQCETIQNALISHLGGKPKLWMSEVFRPLPGENLPGCIEYGRPTPLIKRALQYRKIITSKASNKTIKVVAPLLVQDRVIGAILLELPGGSDLSPQVADFLKGFSAHCALALHISRQKAVKEWRYEQLSLLRKINLQIAQQHEDMNLFQNVVNLIQDAFHFYFVALYTLDETDQKLHYRASAGIKLTAGQKKKLVFLTGISLGVGLVGQAGKQHIEVFSLDVRKDKRFKPVNGLPDTRSEVGLPLIIEGRLLGVLDIQNDRSDGFHENDLVVLRILADNVAVAVDGVRLVDVLSHRADQLAAVTEVSRLLVSILNVDELIKKVVTIISERFGYPFVHCFLLDSGRSKLVFEAGTGVMSKMLVEHEFSLNLNDKKGIVPFVARQAKTFIANDVSRESVYRENLLPPAHTCSEMAVPLIFNNEVLGVIDIQSDELNTFDEDDRFILEVLAASISTALRNAYLYRTETWRRQVAESFRDIAGLFSTQFTLEVIFQSILKELMHNLPGDAAGIWLINRDGRNKRGNSFTITEVMGVNRQEINSVYLRDEKKFNWLNSAIRAEQPTIRKDTDTYDPIGWCLKFPQNYSAIAAPIWTNDQPLGLIVMVKSEPDRYGAEAITMLSTFSGYTSIAIQNNQLYSSSLEQAWISTVMLQVAEAVQSAKDVESLLETIAHTVPLLIGVDQCAFFLLDKFTSLYRLSAQDGFEGEGKEWLESIPVLPGGKLAFEHIRNGHDLITINGPAAKDQVSDTTKKERGNKFVLLPLHARGELLGAFLVKHDPMSESGNAKQQLNVLQGIAQQTAVALENIQLKESEQSEAYVTAVLLQVARTVVSSNDLHETLKTVATILPYLVGVETVLIYQFDSEKDIFHLRGSFSEKWKNEIMTLAVNIKPGEFPLLDKVKNEHQTLIFPAMSSSPLRWNNQIKLDKAQTKFKSLSGQPDVLFALPLLIRNELFGALLVEESSTNYAYREKRFEIIHDVGQQIAMAIQSDQLMKEMVDKERLNREMQLANEIQRTFLPDEMPVIPGWEVAVRWRPAQQVSGDFYDVFQLPDGRYGFVIADVSDKGIPAALYMTVTRTLVHASAMDGESPSQTLFQVNKLLVENSREGLFTTVFYCLIDPGNGNLTYCNAGHNLPVWLHANSRKIEPLEKGGTALGAIPEIYLCDTDIKLQANDCLVLYTDGVTEARSGNDRLFGINRLKKFMQNEFGKKASDVLDDLDTELTRFRDSQPQSDDITIMGIRRTN